LPHRDFPNHGVSCCTLGVFGKLLMRRGAPIWFEIIWSHDVKEYVKLYWFGGVLGVVEKPLASQS